MQNKRTGITCSTFDLFHAGHVKMLEEAKKDCDYLIVALQTDPSIDRLDSKNPPIQTLVERYIQVNACKYVDEIVPYQTEKDLEDIFASFDLECRVIGIEYKDKDFTGKATCLKRGIDIIYNKRDHSFSSTELRSRVWEVEHIKTLEEIKNKFNKS